MNTFGTLFRLTSFGESHGPGIGGVVDGMPAGIVVDMDFVRSEMQRRRPGQSAVTTGRQEPDEVEFLSGIFEGRTTGTPIGFIIRNTNQHSNDYDNLREVLRPSHADYTYWQKYGVRDHRGGGRSSAREMEELILKVKGEGDTIGGIVTCVITGCPVGLGDPVFGKLHAALGNAMLSINACKGFDYGRGFDGVGERGSEQNDQFVNTENGIATATNRSGGIQGGISNGQPIYFRAAFKPVATQLGEQTTLDIHGNTQTLQAKGRHDPCVVPRAVPIVEAMAAITVLDHYLQYRSRLNFIANKG